MRALQVIDLPFSRGAIKLFVQSLYDATAQEVVGDDFEQGTCDTLAQVHYIVRYIVHYMVHYLVHYMAHYKVHYEVHYMVHNIVHYSYWLLTHDRAPNA